MLNENIIKYLEMGDLDEKTRNETLLRVGKIIYQAVILRVLELLDDEEKKSFEQLLDKDDQGGSKEAEIFEFLQKYVPNLNQITEEELAKLKKETVSVMQKKA